MPAIERYQGPHFQVLRRYLRTRPDQAAALDILILSARFGLLAPATPIPDYDLRMIMPRAAELQPSVRECLVQLSQDKQYQRVCLALGRDYLAAVDGIKPLMAEGCQVTTLHGSQGQRLAQLHRWLYGDAPALPARQGTRRSQARIRGVTLALAPAQILAQARQALAAQADSSARFHAWYVEIDGQRVGAKWLVSLLTGLPLSRFTTTEARRVLTALGIEVCSQ